MRMSPFLSTKHEWMIRYLIVTVLDKGEFLCLIYSELRFHPVKSGGAIPCFLFCV